MKKEPSRCICQIEKVLRSAESIVWGKNPAQNRYIWMPGGGRLIKMSAVNQRSADFTSAAFKNPDLSIHRPNIRAHFMWYKRCLFNAVFLPCKADVILLRANISLFYFKDGFRIKIYINNPDRPVEALKTEYELRKRVEKMGIVKVPSLLMGHFDDEPVFFMDEVIAGKLLAWSDPGAKDVFKRLIPDIWKYYQAVGIRWVTPGERGDDVDNIICEYVQALEARPEISFSFDLNKIDRFKNQLTPGTQIHGDLAIHNILVSDGGDYLLDWESSCSDYLMRDFHKLMIINGWGLERQVLPLMETEIERQCVAGRDNLLSFDDQLYWVLFLEIHKMLTTPSYPDRLLRRAQREMNAFLRTR